MYSKTGVVLCVLTLVIFLSSVVAADNMVDNPDFEADTEGWSIGADYGSLALGGAGIVGNALFAQIDSVGANSWEPEVHSPSFALENGKTYTYAFWAKTEPGVTRDLSVNFEETVTYAGLGEGITVTDQWVDYHFTGVWEEPDAPTTVIHIGFEFLLDDVWFSHFRVYEGEYVEEAVATGITVGSLITFWAKIKSR